MTNIIHETLDNGLNIYLCPDDKKHTVVVDFIVKYGGAISDFKSNGVEYHLNDGMAHLIEHTMYEKNAVGNNREIYGNRYMKTNAVTRRFTTEYYVVTTNDVNYALENLIKSLACFSATKEDMAKIKEPIYREISMHNDNVGRRIGDTIYENLFNNYSYRNGLGREDDVKNFDYETIKLCFETFYQPQNEILFMYGNFNQEEVLQKIKDIYKQLDIKKIPFEIISQKERKQVKNSTSDIVMPISKEQVTLAYKIDLRKYTKEEYSHVLSYYINLFRLMNFSWLSPLNKELLEDKIIDGDLGCYNSYYQGFAILEICAYVNNGSEFIKRVQDLFKKGFNFDEDCFNLVLKQSKTNIICMDRTSFGYSRVFINNIDGYDLPELIAIKELDNLNYADYKKFIASLDFKNYTVIKVKDKDTK